MCSCSQCAFRPGLKSRFKRSFRKSRLEFSFCFERLSLTGCASGPLLLEVGCETLACFCACACGRRGSANLRLSLSVPVALGCWPYPDAELLPTHMNVLCACRPSRSGAEQKSTCHCTCIPGFVVAADALCACRPGQMPSRFCLEMLIVSFLECQGFTS